MLPCVYEIEYVVVKNFQGSVENIYVELFSMGVIKELSGNILFQMPTFTLHGVLCGIW